MDIPETEAGRALWFDMTANSGGPALQPAWIEHLRERIIAIEAEARAAGLRETAGLREALWGVIDRSMPSHSTVCASQSDEAECICETGPAMDRAYAFLAGAAR